MPNAEIYLDYNATAPLLPSALDGMLSVLKSPLGNPSSTHQWGQRARRLLTKARSILSQTLSCDPDHLIFTSGGTEANNHVLRQPGWDSLFIDATSHDSVYKAADRATYIPVLPSGVLDLEALEQALQKKEGKSLVSINLVNNETGVIQPLAEITALIKKYTGFLHLDASQALGKIPLSFQDSGADLMTVCAHKMGGPQGVGALIVKETVPLITLLRGGGQEKNRRAGSENLAAIHGWAETLANMPSLMFLQKEHQQLEHELKSMHPAVRVFGEETARAPNVTNISMPGVLSHTQVMNFDLKGIAVSAGSACSSGKVSHSRIIDAMQGGLENAQTTVRISSGWKTRADDFKHFAQAWKKIFTQTYKKGL